MLIVDDSLTVRMDLAEALETAGFQTVPCRTLAEARVALRSHPIALAVLDIQLPDGDGVDLLAQIRRDSTLCELPVLMLSTEAEIKDRIRGIRGGANDFIGKPYDTYYVISRIRQLIGAPPIHDLVLIIDDSLRFRGELSEALAKAGFAIATATGGNEGLRMAATLRPTAIVVDGIMPDMDGASVIRRLRLDPGLRTIPCLLLTGSDARDAEVHALDAGADGFIRKNDLGLIVARVRALLRSTGPLRGDADSLLAPKRILAVDDDPDYRSLLAERLLKRGYDVVHAISGEDAIALLDVQSVDCILLDRSMAGIGGIEACRRLKGSPVVRDTPLIILTASEQRDAMLEGLSAGADDFVSKAAGFEVLSARIQAQIRRKQIEDEQRKVREQLLRSELEAAEARAAKVLAEARAAMAEELSRTNDELAQANRELEAFSYSVSHDLRAPLRTISAFTHAIIEDFGERVDDKARDHIRRVLSATSRMSDLIDALLELSRISRTPIGRHRVDLSQLASIAVDELVRREPARAVGVEITPGLIVDADGRLMRILLDNLLGNAWKFTSRADPARIEVGREPHSGDAVYFVRDNGAGFDMSQADRLFTPFQRLHSDGEFSGTGIGLATVRRIIERHGGKIWAEGSIGCGAKISFTVPIIR
ncbi:MAG: response regulator [Deltaproteobacteria bacterium]|nr:MAG: response regulator [Deltaproteobacteria bacterium]TMQ07417.1 MAG: response regulator [Deltaproteobacteria bacterium]